MSIAASDMKTRAIAKSPTSAIASAAELNGRPVPIEGMIAAAATMAPKTTYGAMRNSGEAVSAITASLWNSLRMPWYGSSRLGARRFCSQARHTLTQPGTGREDQCREHLQELGEPGTEFAAYREQDDQRDEAVRRYVEMRPCCIQADGIRRPLHDAARGAAYRARQNRSADDHAIAGRRGRSGEGSSRSISKNESKMCRIGWPNPSAVSCMRASSRAKPQSQAGARRTGRRYRPADDQERQPQHTATITAAGPRARRRRSRSGNGASTTRTSPVGRAPTRQLRAWRSRAHG